jgi:integral membrane protein
VLLGIAMPLKYLAGRPEAVRIVGSAHGVLFIVYVVMALLAARLRKWPAALLGQAMIAAVVPLGPFWFDAKIKNDPNA